MRKIAIACAALNNRIYVGRINKAGTDFLAGKQDVTDEVVRAVVNMIKPGRIMAVAVDGVTRYEIEVRDIGGVG